MATIQFSLTLAKEFTLRSLEVPAQTHTIEATFADGDHVFTSPDFQLGTVHHLAARPLMGRIVFRYSFDSASSTVTICDTDFPSSDGMTLITSPQGINESCIEHAADIGALADEGGQNSLWNYHSQLLSGAPEVFKSLVRGANESLKTAVIADTKLNIRLRQTLPELSSETYLSLCPVYRAGSFLEHFDSSKQYEADDVVSPVESVFKGVQPMAKGAAFANVIASTGDPYPKGYTAWIQLWTTQTKSVAPQCTSLSWGVPMPYTCYPVSTVPPYSPVGGHILLGTSTAAPRAAGANDVYIVPICFTHNKNTYTAGMQAQAATQVVWLNDYMQKGPSTFLQALPN